jgi:hypothetical protein
VLSFSVGNFKAFQEQQRVPLRPLTLVFGGNSAGKSSIIHALALAHEATRSGRLDVARTELGGTGLDLGGFAQFVFARDLTRQVTLGFELGNVSTASGTHLQLEAVEIEVGIGVPTEGISRPRVERVAITSDDEALLQLSARQDGTLRLDRLNREHPAMTAVVTGLLQLATTATSVAATDDAAVDRAFDDVVPTLSAKVVGLLPLLEDGLPAGSDSLLPISKANREQDLERAVRQLLPGVLRSVLRAVRADLTSWLAGLHYLGPLRSYPERHLGPTRDDPDWLAGGGFAWDVVRNDAAVREQVNAWLSHSRLKTPYQLLVRDVVSTRVLPDRLAPLLSEALANFARSTLLIEEDSSVSALIGAVRDSGGADADVALLIAALLDPDEAAEEWAADLTLDADPARRDLVLIDRRMGTEVSHRDVGVGVSQVLPVLVSAFATTKGVVAIEQPELHLHPALQADLADVFIESIARAQGERSFILETHSEHLILRVLRRIREGSEDPASRLIGPEDVSVLYVAPTPTGGVVKQIRIDEAGEFLDPWPEGFFAERAEELFG